MTTEKTPAAKLAKKVNNALVANVCGLVDFYNGSQRGVERVVEALGGLSQQHEVRFYEYRIIGSNQLSSFIGKLALMRSLNDPMIRENLNFFVKDTGRLKNINGGISQAIEYKVFIYHDMPSDVFTSLAMHSTAYSLELMGETRYPHFRYNEMAEILHGVVRGLQLLHKAGIAHRSVNSHTILANADFTRFSFSSLEHASRSNIFAGRIDPQCLLAPAVDLRESLHDKG